MDLRRKRLHQETWKRDDVTRFGRGRLAWVEPQKGFELTCALQAPEWAPGDHPHPGWSLEVEAGDEFGAAVVRHQPPDRGGVAQGDQAF